MAKKNRIRSPAPFRLILGSDHAGYRLKCDLKEKLASWNVEMEDVGTFSERSVDYPDCAESLALQLLKKQSQGFSETRAILICGSGVGASIAANKIPGIRAGLCHDTYSAHQGVEHDDMNVLVLGARVIGVELAVELCLTFLKAKFDRQPRHERRVQKIGDLESKYFSASFETSFSTYRDAEKRSA